MLRISNPKTSVSKTVDATRFYYDSLQPMIIDPAPYGSRDWDEASKIFFNVPESNSELSKSQLTENQLIVLNLINSPLNWQTGRLLLL